MSPAVPIIIILIATIIFFMIRWILGRSRVTKNKNIIAGFMAVFLSPVIYILIMFFMIFKSVNIPSTTFDSLKWKINAQQRYTMAQDIIDSSLLVGKSEAEVVTLLGDGYTRALRGILHYPLGNVEKENGETVQLFLNVLFQDDKVFAVTLIDPRK